VPRIDIFGNKNTGPGVQAVQQLKCVQVVSREGGKARGGGGTKNLAQDPTQGSLSSILINIGHCFNNYRYQSNQTLAGHGVASVETRSTHRN
jgi:hypothetical protein